MDILSMLQADHRDFSAALESLDSRILDNPNKYHSLGFSTEASLAATRVLRELLPKLDRHELVEREVLFPELVLRRAAAAASLDALDREHEGLRSMISRVMRELPDSTNLPMTRAILEVVHLTNALKTHFLREDSDIYKLAAELLSPADRERLGELAQRKLAQR